MAVVVEARDRRFLDGAVHPLGLVVGPGWFGPSTTLGRALVSRCSMAFASQILSKRIWRDQAAMRLRGCSANWMPPFGFDPPDQSAAAGVADDHARPSPLADQVDQLTYGPLAGDRGVHHRLQAFARDVVDDVEHAEAPAGGELVVHQVQAQRWLGSASTGAACRPSTSSGEPWRSRCSSEDCSRFIPSVPSEGPVSRSRRMKKRGSRHKPSLQIASPAFAHHHRRRSVSPH